jgi:cobalt-zinc-cadmium efflux system outer membrane protein
MRYSTLPNYWAMLVLFILLGLGTSAFGSPDTEELPNAITLQEAVTRALANNQGIKVSKFDVNIEKARRQTGALPTPFTLNAEVENFGGTDDFSGVDLAETTLQVSKVLELGDKQQYRADLGDARVNLAEFESTVRELELTAAVSRQFAGLLRTQSQIDTVAESIEISNRTLQIVQKRVAVGRASEAEQSSAAVALSRTKLIGARLQFEIAAARVNLSTLWGSTTPDFTLVAGDIESLPPLPAYEELKSRLTDNPNIKRIASNSQILSAQRRLAESSRRSDLELSAGVRHLAATDDMAMVVSINMPFGSKKRADSLVRASEMEISKAPMVQNDQLLNLEAALFSFYQALLAARSELEILQNEIIPEAERAVHFYERGFELGSYSLLELTASQERLLIVRSQALDAATSFHFTLIEIESLLGSFNPGGALQ